MSQLQKLISKIHSNPKDISFEELHRYLEKSGATWTEGKGSHRYYSFNARYLSVPRHKPIKAIYITKAVEMIDGEV